LLPAMQDWPSIAPDDIRCPVQLVVGSGNEPGMEWLERSKRKLGKQDVQIRLLEGLDHHQELTEIDTLYTDLKTFFESHLDKST
jgi:hypothetical protein